MQKFRKSIAATGDELGIPEDWMNDAVKGFISENEELVDGKDYEYGELSVSSPSLEYLLAMKCMSMRSIEDSPHDRKDIKILLNLLKNRFCRTGFQYHREVLSDTENSCKNDIWSGRDC